MRNLKKVVAIALAATMVLGSSLTTFAAGETSGESVGTGSSEGHVDKKKTNVVLPTIAEGAVSPFTYTMDPEGLVSGTDHAKYENAEFPTTGDTGVYFNTGKKGGDGSDKDNIVYANTSVALDAVNKISHSIDLTVKAEAVNASTDIPLIARDALATATDASLYLGLIVNTEAAVAVTKDTPATKTVSVAGTEDNFKIAAKTDKSGYEYRELTLAEYQALDGNTSKTQEDFDATWKRASFKLEGSTTTDKAITSATTAPNVKVTWSWVDPSANAAPTIATTSYVATSGAALPVTVSLGIGDKSATDITGITNMNANVAVPTARYSFDGSTLTFDAAFITNNMNSISSSDGLKLKVLFNDTAKTEVVLTITSATTE